MFIARKGPWTCLLKTPDLPSNVLKSRCSRTEQANLEPKCFGKTEQNATKLQACNATQAESLKPHSKDEPIHLILNMSHFRAPILWILCWVSLLTAPAWGMNLGHTSIQSKQGEALRATIAIEASSPEELEGLRAKLFTQKDYQTLGLTWENSLAQTDLKIVQDPLGKFKIMLEGRQAVEQSFVELFFELHWNSGQVNKQVGLLLDTAVPPSSQESDKLSDRYVLVNQGDSASALIKPYLPSDVSMDQMLLALVRSNPKSFVNGNANRLLAGSSLQIPTAAVAQQENVQTAESLIREQHASFNSYRQALLGKLKNQQAMQPRPHQQASGLVNDPKKNKNSGKDQLTLNKANADKLEALAKERAEKETAEKLKEIQDNIKDLQALAKTDTAPWWLKLWSFALASTSNAWGSTKDWLFASLPVLQQYSAWPLAPVITGLVFAFFVLLSLWGIKRSKHNAAHAPRSEPQDSSDWRDHDAHGMTPPSFNDSFAKTAGHAHLDEPTHLSAQDLLQQQKLGLAQTQPLGSGANTHPLGSVEDDRVKLAEDLWEIGQHHTAYAIAQEVLQQSTGKEFDRAKKWLEGHAI